MEAGNDRARTARATTNIGHKARHGAGGDSGGFSYRPGEVLVRTQDEPRVSRELRRRGAVLVSRAFGTSLFRLPADQDVPTVVEALRALDGRPRVAPNHVLRAALHDQWHPAAPAAPADALDELPRGTHLAGSDVRVGVIDTGVDLRGWFDDRVKRASGDGDREELDEDGDGALDFEAGHGTHVAGIVLQHAPGAEVFVRGVIDTHGHLDDAAACAAIVGLVAEHSIDILNLSFGGYTRDEAGLASTRRALQTARAINPDLVVVAAAGNDGLRRPFFPAAYPNVVAVGALDADGNQAPFSNYGNDWVDCCARGVDVVSTFVDWNGAVETVSHDQEHTHGPSAQQFGYQRFEGWARWSGTSFAAPRVAGAIAAAMSPKGMGRRLTGKQAVVKVVRDPQAERSEDMGTVVNPENYVDKSSR